VIENEFTGLAVELVQRIKAKLQTELETRAARPQSNVEPRLLTAKQAAEYIGRSEQAVRHLIFQRDLPVVRNGRCVRLDRKDLDRWIENYKA
jgi:excisionase family DNA binding protein